MAGPRITAEQIETIVAMCATLDAEIFVDNRAKSAIYLAKSLVEEVDDKGNVRVIPFEIWGDLV